jgi:glycosyltransferase involved in cell wall biosynthesis
MRILLTVHQFFPDSKGGTEVLTLHTAQELQRRGHEVTVFAAHPTTDPLRDDQRFDWITHEGIRVRRFLHQHVPMGDQTNTTEMEYDNHFLGQEFQRFLNDTPQDVVHFFHLSRLTTAAVDATLGQTSQRHPPATLFTITDFWPVCRTSQLRLPDGSMCQGPGPFAANCVQHLMVLAQTTKIASRLRLIPEPVMAAGVIAIKEGFFPERWYTPFVRAVEARPDFVRQRMNQLDRILVPTRLMENILTHNGVHPSILRYVPYGIDLKQMRRDTDKGRSPALRVGFIGTLFEHKGCHLLIDAVRSLDATLPIELKIYGNMSEFPDYAHDLKRRAAEDPRITFAGTFPNHQIGEIFAGLDALVVPSIWYENTPLVIYSSMAAGCPVVATNLGGMSEAIRDRITGLLFEKGNVPQLAAHLQHLTHDRDFLRQLAANTPIPKSIPQYVDELEAAYQNILAKRSAAIGGR